MKPRAFPSYIFRVLLCCSVQLALLPFLKAENYSVVNNTCEVVVYFDDARPPVIELFEMTPNKGGGWGLVQICYDSDGDWMLDTTMYFLSSEKAVIEPMFKHMRNKLPVYRKIDFYDAYVNEPKFRLDGYGRQRLLVRPEFDNAEVPKIRALPAYKKVMSDLAGTALSTPPKIPLTPK